MLSNVMIPKYIFIEMYTVTFPIKAGWRNGTPVKAKSYWYTYGPKKELSVGVGIYR